MSTSREGARRRSPRVAIRVDGTLSTRTPRPLSVLDLSLSGCLVRLGAPLDAGAIFDLRLDLEPPLVTKVRVADCSLDGSAVAAEGNTYLAGLQFLGLSAQDQDRMRRFIDLERRRPGGADAAPH